MLLNILNNPLSEEELTQQVSDIVKEITDYGFMSSVVKLGEQDVIVIANSGDGTTEDPIIPLFFLPSPELMLGLTDPETGEHLFKLANTN